MEFNRILLRQISVLSILFGAIAGFITLIPYIDIFSFLFLNFAMAPLVIWLLVKYNCISLSTIKESVTIGAISGFVAYLAFSFVYLPLAWIILRFFHFTNNYGIALIIDNAGFFMLTVITLFMGVLSATINSFTGFLTFYVIEIINSVSKK